MTEPAVNEDRAPILRRHMWIAVLIAALVVIPRSVWIMHEHSTCCDDDPHLYHGLNLLRGDWKALHLAVINDAPGGEAVCAIPAFLNGVHLRDSAEDLHMGQYPPQPKNCFTLPQSIRIETAIWKSLLLLPAVGVMFYWTASVYSLASGWLCIAMMLCEPTLAAHTPLPTIDVLGMAGVVCGCWALWWFVQKPTERRMVRAAVVVGTCMSMKQSAIILPGVAVLFAAVQWLGREKLWRRPKELRTRLRLFLPATGIVALVIWVFVRFNSSVPETFNIALPAGLYVTSVAYFLEHIQAGHQAYLWGEMQLRGWWYYFPVLATYKIPIGIGVVFLLGIVSLAWVRPRYQELPIFLGFVLWLYCSLTQHINIGFRHFLPVEMFMMMLASRCLARGGIAISIVAWLAVTGAAVDVARWTPDYLSYVNFPRKDVWLQISDSNLDWGQGRVRVERWLESLPQDGRPVYYGYFGPIDVNLFDQLGPRLTQYSSLGHWIHRTSQSVGGDILPERHGLPDHGLLVVSAVAMAGQYESNDIYAPLRHIEPDKTLSNYLLVYDLDRLRETGKLPAASATKEQP